MTRWERLQIAVFLSAVAGIAVATLRQLVTLDARLKQVAKQVNSLERLTQKSKPSGVAQMVAQFLADQAMQAMAQAGSAASLTEPEGDVDLSDVSVDMVSIYVLPTQPNTPPQATVSGKDFKAVVTWSADQGTWTVEGAGQVTDDLASAITEHAKSLGVDI